MVEKIETKALKGINKATEQIHIAVQFLAMAGAHFVEPKEDTSHMNLGWLTMKEKFITHPFGPEKEYVMELCPAEMTITILRTSDRQQEELKLKGLTQKEVVKWIKEVLNKYKIASAKKYKISPPYDLPEYTNREEKKFKMSPKKAFEVFSKLRSNADHYINKYSLNFAEADETRTWPHHFDHASLVTLSKDKNGNATKTMGLGLAIHDGMIPEPYYYISVWQKDKDLDLSKMKDLTNGEWIDDGYKGSVLRLSSISESDNQDKLVDNFFQESIEAIMKLLKVKNAGKK